jgi:hypothetical protein
MNRFGKEFFNLVRNSTQSLINFSPEKEISLNGNRFISVIELTYSNFSKKLLENCLKIAKEKAQKTMSKNQAGEDRPFEIKVINQFRGVLAETIVHLYLHYECGIPLQNIKRYDLERRTFDYSPEEYDLKIIKNGKEYTLEVRSSHDYYGDLKKYLEKRGIICAYINKYKLQENIKDISCAVIFQLKGYSGPLDNNTRSKFFEDFERERYKIYFITHCATKDVCKEKSYKTNLGQKSTEYLIVPFRTISQPEFHIKNVVSRL